MRHLDRALDGSDGAVAGASRTTFTLVSVDDILFEGLALSGRTFLFGHVSHVLIPEVVDGGQNGVRGGLTQTAEGGVFDDLAEVLQQGEVFHGAVTLGNAAKDFAQALVTDTARGALTAGFLHGEVEVELGDGDHAGGLVHDDHTAGAHHGAGSHEVVVVDRGVEELLGQAAAGRTAGLHGFEPRSNRRC